MSERDHPLIDWDPNTSRSRAAKRGDAVSRRSITIVLVAFIGLMVGFFYLMGRESGPRNIDAQEIVDLQLLAVSERTEDGIHIVRGGVSRNGVDIDGNILYANNMWGSEVAKTDQFEFELKHIRSIASDPVMVEQIAVRNAVVICEMGWMCSFVANRLEYTTFLADRLENTN